MQVEAYSKENNMGLSLCSEIKNRISLVQKQKAYRFEQKYYVDAIQIELLRSRLNGLLSLDAHAGESFYEIRSVYFDDIDNTCYQKNEAGVDERAKYRIRAYNCSDSRIMLEKKIKQGGKTRKFSVPLTREQCDTLLSGKNLSLEQKDFESYTPLLQQFCILIETRKMQPKVIVCYDRIPYVYKQGNVRVTFDLNISSAKDFDKFFEKNLPKRPIMSKGKHLMEVKYDEFLPKFIKDSLEIGFLSQTTFSKYYLCRKAAL